MFGEHGVEFKWFGCGVDGIHFNVFYKDGELIPYGYFPIWLSANKAKIILNVNEVTPDIGKKLKQEIMIIVKEKVEKFEKELKEELEKHPLIEKIQEKEK